MNSRVRQRGNDVVALRMPVHDLDLIHVLLRLNSRGEDGGE